MITAQNLSKSYLLGHQSKVPHSTFREWLARLPSQLWLQISDVASGRPIGLGDETEEFWALDDVSFDIRRGEIVGFLGPNGAGKSTLLKVLSRITEPTKGRVTIKGRLGSLLEVGTGFHPELTGRENIYLNGAIIGMRRAEVKKCFDEIVSFAGVERFLDTPVKRYSSGMYVRLAFAVAAHLDPEILIVDEVLAVGDAQFQKKCLGKMKEVSSQSGRTVLFVSHSMAALKSICHRGVLLRTGRIAYDGDIRDCIQHYETAMAQLRQGSEWVREGEGANAGNFLRSAGRVGSGSSTGPDA